MDELLSLYKENIGLLDKLIELEIGDFSDDELALYKDDMIELKELREERKLCQMTFDMISGGVSIEPNELSNIMDIMKLNNRNYLILLDIRSK